MFWNSRSGDGGRMVAMISAFADDIDIIAQSSQVAT